MASTKQSVNGDRPGPSEADERRPRLLHAGADQMVLTVEEVARLLRVPVSWVYERTRKRSVDRIPGFRLGKYWRFRQTDVLAWLERQRVGVRPNARRNGYNPR